MSAEKRVDDGYWKNETNLKEHVLGVSYESRIHKAKSDDEDWLNEDHKN